MMKKSLAILALTATVSVPALTQGVTATADALTFNTPKEAIDHRKDAFVQTQKSFKVLADMVGGRAQYDAATAAQKAKEAAEAIRKPWAGFGPGTEGGDARAEVWSKRAEFDRLAREAEEKLDALAVAAQSGKLDDLKAALGPAGGACKTCHDGYKNK